MEASEVAASKRRAQRKLVASVAISFTIAALELTGGILANSIAIITDAVHDGADGLGFALSLLFLWLAQKTSTNVLTFGYKRVEVLGAVLNISLIWLIAFGIMYEAGVRMRMIITKDPLYRPIDAKVMLITSIIGMVSNVIILAILRGGHAHGLGMSHGHSHAGGSHAHSHHLKGESKVFSSHSHSHENSATGHSHGERDLHGHSHDTTWHGHSHSGSSHAHSHDDTSHDDTSHGHSHSGISQASSHDDTSHGHSHEAVSQDGYSHITATPEGSNLPSEGNIVELDDATTFNLRRPVASNQVFTYSSMSNDLNDHEQGFNKSDNVQGTSSGYSGTANDVEIDGDDVLIFDDRAHQHGHSHKVYDHGHGHAAKPQRSKLVHPRLDLVDPAIHIQPKLTHNLNLVRNRDSVDRYDFKSSTLNIHALATDLESGMIELKPLEDMPKAERDSTSFETSQPLAQPNVSEDINVMSAMAHAIGHVMQDLGIVLASILIWSLPHIPMIQIIDPVASILFTILGLYPTLSLLKLTIRILMQGVPSHLDVVAIRQDFEAIPGVLTIHELHIWSLSIDDAFLTVHLVMDNSQAPNNGNNSATLQAIRNDLAVKYGIIRASIQLESQGDICMEASSRVDEEWSS